MKAAGVVALMTLIGRILGLVRDIVSAKTFGTSWQWDAFLYAFMLPNLFRLGGELGQFFTEGFQFRKNGHVFRAFFGITSNTFCSRTNIGH